MTQRLTYEGGEALESQMDIIEGIKESLDFIKTQFKDLECRQFYKIDVASAYLDAALEFLTEVME